MAEPSPKPWTIDEFLEWEAWQPTRYEYLDGVIRMMVGGTNAHTIIKDNCFRALDRVLRGKPCRVMGEGPKVVVGHASLYPDLTVTCSPVEMGDDRIREPVVLVEVLSPSTEDQARGSKWVHYQDIPSLQHYLLVAQDERRVEVYTRCEVGWHLQVVRPPVADFNLAAIGVTLTLDEVYEDSGA